MQELNPIIAMPPVPLKQGLGNLVPQSLPYTSRSPAATVDTPVIPGLRASPLVAKLASPGWGVAGRVHMAHYGPGL